MARVPDRFGDILRVCKLKKVQRFVAYTHSYLKAELLRRKGYCITGTVGF